jgi:hypothetical protein
LQQRIPQICELILRRLGQRFPDWEAHSAFTRLQITAFLADSLGSQLRAFARKELPGAAPALDDEAARAAGRAGEFSAFLGTYRAAQAVLWESWFSLIEDSDLASQDRRYLLGRGSDFFFRYADLLGDFATAIYDEDRPARHGGRAQRLFTAVKTVLDGEQPASSSGLDLEFSQHHLGLIGWGEGCNEVARKLAKDLGRPLLLVAPIEGTCWGWLSGARPTGPELAQALARLEFVAGAGLTLGDEEFGEQGFRITHRQAQRARLLADPERQLTLFGDVAVEALASENTDEARRFVARELGPIGDDSQVSRRLRDTLSAYFAAEHNAACAAARLDVHQQTVANRLRVVEERLGRPVGARRIELELALRLRALLIPEPRLDTGLPTGSICENRDVSVAGHST